MINSFRRMRTGKPDGCGRESGRGRERKPEAGSPEARKARKPGSPAALLPWRAGSGAKPPTKEAGAGAAEAMSFFSCAVFFCGCRLSAAAAESHPRRQILERLRVPFWGRNVKDCKRENKIFADGKIAVFVCRAASHPVDGSKQRGREDGGGEKKGGGAREIIGCYD